MTDEMKKSDDIIPAEEAEEKKSDDYLNDIPEFDDNYTIEMLIQKILTDDRQYDVSKIVSAYEFAAKAHERQKRS